VDEVYEFLEAVEGGNDSHMCEELGDLLMQVVFHCQMAAERNAFTITDVVKGLTRKLYLRHPHVFGSEKKNTPAQVVEKWEEIKAREKPHRSSVLDGVPKSLPALFKAEKLQRKAARVGFDWKEITPVLEKVREEFEEFQEALTRNDRERAHEELGDILFALVNVARHCDISAEQALRDTIHKFGSRFRHVERRMKEQGKAWNAASLEEMDVLWEEAKEAEAARSGAED
jgi:tetrapyrrole methylase family protein/MazG family protein